MKCAVVSKLFFGELPYLKSFLEYYLSIGIQKFYFVNTIPEYYDMIIEYLDDYIAKLNGWNVRVLKQPELILDRDYEKISQKIQDDIEDLAEYYTDVPAWDVGGRYGYLNTVRQEFSVWFFEKVKEEVDNT